MQLFNTHIALGVLPVSPCPFPLQSLNGQHLLPKQLSPIPQAHLLTISAALNDSHSTRFHVTIIQGLLFSVPRSKLHTLLAIQDPWATFLSWHRETLPNIWTGHCLVAVPCGLWQEPVTSSDSYYCVHCGQAKTLRSAGN